MDPERGPPQPRPPLARWERYAMATAAVAAFSWFWAWRAHTLTTWDSALFALALEDYDVYRLRPHAPGYPLFVALARPVYALFSDANLALVTTSATFAALTLPLLYLLVRRFGPPRAALVAIILFAVSPTLVYNGVTATSYTAEAFFSVALALVAWHAAHRPGVASASALGALFGLAAGVRASLALFLAPLVAAALLWPRVVAWSAAGPARPRVLRAGLLESGAAALAVAVTVAVWAVPMVMQSGGIDAYRAATAYQSREVVFAESVFLHGVGPLADHAERMLWFLRHELTYLPLWFGVLALGWFSVRVPRRAPDPPTGARHRVAVPAPGAFFALWTLPALAFHILVFNGWGRGPVGYVLVFLPALYALAALGADRIATHIEARAPARDRRALAWGRALLLALLLAPAPLLASAAHDDVAKEVWAHDAWVAAWTGLPATFPPNETVLLVSHSWAHAKWYHPDYRVFAPFAVPDDGPLGLRRFVLETHARADEVPFYAPHVDGSGLPEHPLPPGTRAVVVYDFQLAGENDGVRQIVPDVTIEEAFLPSGWRVLYFEPTPDRPTVEAYLRPLADVVAEGGP